MLMLWFGKKKNILFVIIIMTNPFKMYHKNKLINTKYFFFFFQNVVGRFDSWLILLFRACFEALNA